MGVPKNHNKLKCKRSFKAKHESTYLFRDAAGRPQRALAPGTVPLLSPILHTGILIPHFNTELGLGVFLGQLLRGLHNR